MQYQQMRERLIKRQLIWARRKDWKILKVQAKKLEAEKLLKVHLFISQLLQLDSISFLNYCSWIQ